MAVTYEDVIPTLIENTTMQKRIFDGVHRAYTITPIDGYVIHHKDADWTEIDEETGEEVIKLGYKSGMITCSASYDFIANPFEIYAVPRDSVPADQIFGGTSGLD